MYLKKRVNCETRRLGPEHKTDQLLAEDKTTQTVRGVRSYMNHIPEFDCSSLADDNPFASPGVSRLAKTTY